MAVPRARAFDAVHAAVPAMLLAGTVALCMLAVEPVLVAVSLAGALAFSLVARGARPTLRGLAWQLPLLALVCLANPFFSASGSTLLFKLGPRSVYLESLAYGATMGALLVAVVLWLQCAATVLTQDRLLALAPRRARAVPLLLGMVAQLVPQLLRRSRDVRASLAACTAAGPRPAARDALTRTSSLLLSWSLEESLERADSMRARGWESGRPRTAYRSERLRLRDAASLAGIAVLLVLAAACAWGLCAQWHFYPRMTAPAPWWAYAPFALLAFLPVVAELVARLRERGRL
ncbi:energy-coupling factor transporter transmembrane protein EcfT [Thermophilibacter sp.]|uniref:energy-coupling factor transporter transmembrane protein EcfT n=1 Tax=Thermophilibacter sp. TaxID=2847309 RepID=UPI003A8C9377